MVSEMYNLLLFSFNFRSNIFIDRVKSFADVAFPLITFYYGILTVTTFRVFIYQSNKFQRPYIYNPLIITTRPAKL